MSSRDFNLVGRISQLSTQLEDFGKQLATLKKEVDQKAEVPQKAKFLPGDVVTWKSGENTGKLFIVMGEGYLTRHADSLYRTPPPGTIRLTDGRTTWTPLKTSLRLVLRPDAVA